MASVDTHYSAALPASLPDRSVAGGTSTQPGRADNKPSAGIDWFSSAQAAEYLPITIRANAAVAGATTLDALASNILSHIGEYTPD
ncbi:MAG: hypothetical protein L3J88_08180 [Gammaproteobacteria bacterium]|nr:hypothetical protein [Gammaproteobacteria bacterium]MCF6363308.1 hypothetical protein [Gammaproteobacteria bacterium]